MLVRITTELIPFLVANVVYCIGIGDQIPTDPDEVTFVTIEHAEDMVDTAWSAAFNH